MNAIAEGEPLEEELLELRIKNLLLNNCFIWNFIFYGKYWFFWKKEKKFLCFNDEETLIGIIIYSALIWYGFFIIRWYPLWFFDVKAKSDRLSLAN